MLAVLFNVQGLHCLEDTPYGLPRNFMLGYEDVDIRRNLVQERA